MSLQKLPAEYLSDLARQFCFISAFLGGCSATFLGALLMTESKIRPVGEAIRTAALAAGAFTIAAISAAMLAAALHPNAPASVAENASILHARIVTVLFFLIGVCSFLVTIGISGFIHSRKTGIITLIISVISCIFATWAMVGF